MLGLPASARRYCLAPAPGQHQVMILAVAAMVAAARGLLPARAESSVCHGQPRGLQRGESCLAWGSVCAARALSSPRRRCRRVMVRTQALSRLGSQIFAQL